MLELFSAVIARLQPAECIVMDEVLAVGVPISMRQSAHLALPT
jgi:hypothetical protein